MKKLLIFGNFLCLTLVMQAQTDYFLFIQSENNQTFYIQSEGKTLSSSAAGHLIIPGLKDSIYTLNIGFPKNQFPEQLFQVRINKRDAGYQLKNLGAEGWALFNLQTLQLIKALQVQSKKQTISYGDIKKTDVFSTLMAGLVNDSAVLYTSIAKVDPPKENLKTVIPDTPVSTGIVKREEHTNADTSDVKSDTSVIQTGQATAEKPNQRDTSRLQPVAQASQDSVVRDTLTAVSQTLKDQGPRELPTSVVKTLPPKSDSLKKSDTVKVDLVAQPDIQRNDSTANKTVAVMELPQPPTRKVDNIPVPETRPDTQSLEPKSVLKPMIVWFSETKTDRGIELVYFDMTVPDRIDTINILIPKEAIIEVETKKDSNDEVTKAKQEEDGNRRSGKFFEKIFGKNNRRDSIEAKADNRSPRPKESSIKVTTVEEKKVVDPPVAGNKKESGTEEAVTTRDSDKKSAEGKNNPGNFFGRVFGKKSNKSSDKDSISDKGSASVKVTTVETKSSKLPDSATAEGIRKGDENSEVAKLKKAQENEEKTSAERFFGKLFGKKKSKDKDSAYNKSDQNKSEASIKVTTVPGPAAADAKENSKVAISNSDCRDFASDNDLDKLRVRMLGEKDTDGQVTEARKMFKVKCLTTKQVQSLSTVFRTDEGKYKLFDAAYPYVSDTANFKDLVGLLSEEYYINRFKAMVRL